MPTNKIAVVCNSTNPDLVQYFLCKLNTLQNSTLKASYIAFKNKSILTNDSKNMYTSSYTDKAFFDKKLPLDFLISFYILIIVLKNRVTTIHFTTAHISNLFLSIFLKPFKIRQIFTIHDLIPHPGKKAILIKLYNQFVINILSDEVISFSKNEILKQNKSQKFQALTLSGFEQYSNEAKSGQKTILFFGRIEFYKGIENLFNIIEKSNQVNTGYTFIIAGKGTIPNLQQMQNLKNVEIINRFIDDSELKELFQKASFTLLPYNSATQSGVTILSYSYATPVIAYNVGSLSEYIENQKNGFLVDFKMNDKIIQILQETSDDEIKQLSAFAIKSFEKKYSYKACLTYYKEYYKKIMEN